MFLQASRAFRANKAIVPLQTIMTKNCIDEHSSGPLSAFLSISRDCQSTPSSSSTNIYQTTKLPKPQKQNKTKQKKAKHSRRKFSRTLTHSQQNPNQHDVQGRNRLRFRMRLRHQQNALLVRESFPARRDLPIPAVHQHRKQDCYVVRQSHREALMDQGRIRRE